MSEQVRKEVERGARVNALGMLGKMAGPSFLVIVTRMYGADAFGIFITASALIEMAIAFLTAGFKDGALIFVSRHADDEAEHGHLYQSLANALAWSLAFSLMLILAALFIGPVILPDAYEFGDRLVGPLLAMTLALPLMAFDRVVLAATQGLKIMKFEALINGGARPVLLLVSAIAFWFVADDVRGLAAAYVVTQILIALIAVGIYSRELSWSRLGFAVRLFSLNREMISFAVPQNLNATFERFITNVDIVMLGLFGIDARTIGFYGAGSLIVRELRQIKLVFSGAFAPHIVRLFRKQRLEELSLMFSTTSRWIARLVIPAIIAVAILRSDLLAIVSPEYSGEPALFMLFLLPIPYLQGSLGVAGNVVVMTGHSRFNLLNSIATGLSNVLLNLWLIPGYGLVGAAAASALASLVRAVMELAEMVYILRVPLHLRELLQPHIAGVAAAVPAVLLFMFTTWPDRGVVERIAVLAASLAIYVSVLAALQGSVGTLLRRMRSGPPGLDSADSAES
ncbi:MAG: oligosaccharide flippase family protein [Rhodothermales bacterium]|nr:oligosaccharide flippase family protein [Rhodothermales bacterium]